MLHEIRQAPQGVGVTPLQHEHRCEPSQLSLAGFQGFGAHRTERTVVAEVEPPEPLQERLDIGFEGGRKPRPWQRIGAAATGALQAQARPARRVFDRFVPRPYQIGPRRLGRFAEAVFDERAVVAIEVIHRDDIGFDIARRQEPQQGLQPDPAVGREGLGQECPSGADRLHGASRQHRPGQLQGLAQQGSDVAPASGRKPCGEG